VGYECAFCRIFCNYSNINKARTLILHRYVSLCVMYVSRIFEVSVKSHFIVIK